VLYFEDIEVGWRRPCGSHAVEKAEVVEFARQWDPRDFHLDDAAAASKDFLDGDGVCASGLHTLAIWGRLQVQGLGDLAFMLGAGFDEVRFLRPVWPGDVLTAEAECIDKRALASRPGRGLVRFRHQLTNQKGEPVMRMYVNVVMRRRPE